MAVVRRAVLLLALAGSLLAAGCGGRDVAGGSTSQASPACTGAAPLHATMCPGADAGLTSDAPLYLAAACAGAPCSYVCDAGFVAAAHVCLSVPVPREVHFTDNGDGTVTVTDDLGPTTWLRDAGCIDTVGGITSNGGTLPWSDASAWSSQLASGACGLQDGSVAGAWQLPSYGQLMHLTVDLAWGNPFLNFEAGTFWSSWNGDSRGAAVPGRARAVNLYTGDCFDYADTSLFHVWPVRP